jgi:triacylglycerol lipase
MMQGMQDGHDGYTGHPSLVHEIVTLGAKALKVLFTPVGGVLAAVPVKIPLLTDGVPRFFFTRGLDVTQTQFKGMALLAFAPPAPTDKVVVAIHGGSYVGEATIFHWWTYTAVAKKTCATVVIPDYTLSPAGTAETEVPRMADFIAQMIGDHGAQNVSVLGDSAGGGLALLTIDALRLRDRVLAEDIPNVTFRLRKGLLHAFVIYAPLPDARAERTNLYDDLDLVG